MGVPTAQLDATACSGCRDRSRVSSCRARQVQDATGWVWQGGVVRGVGAIVCAVCWGGRELQGFGGTDQG
jgi:hypothetical protein